MRGLLPRTWCPEADVHKPVLAVGSDDQRDARGGAEPVATRVVQPSGVPAVWAVRDNHTAAGGRILAPADGEATGWLVGNDQLKACSRFDDQTCLGKQPPRWIGPPGTGLQSCVARACGQGHHAEHDLEIIAWGLGANVVRALQHRRCRVSRSERCCCPGGRCGRLSGRAYGGRSGVLVRGRSGGAGTEQQRRGDDRGGDCRSGQPTHEPSKALLHPFDVPKSEFPRARRGARSGAAAGDHRFERCLVGSQERHPSRHQRHRRIAHPMQLAGVGVQRSLAQRPSTSSSLVVRDEEPLMDDATSVQSASRAETISRGLRRPGRPTRRARASGQR